MNMSTTEYHPKLYEPVVPAMGLALALFGAIIGMELICRIGINPNTSIIGALIAKLGRLLVTTLVVFYSLAFIAVVTGTVAMLVVKPSVRVPLEIPGVS